MGLRDLTRCVSNRKVSKITVVGKPSEQGWLNVCELLAGVKSPLIWDLKYG